MNKPNFMKYYLNFHVETIVSKINLHNAQNFNDLKLNLINFSTKLMHDFVGVIRMTQAIHCRKFKAVWIKPAKL